MFVAIRVVMALWCDADLQRQVVSVLPPVAASLKAMGLIGLLLSRPKIFSTARGSRSSRPVGPTRCYATWQVSHSAYSRRQIAMRQSFVARLPKPAAWIGRTSQNNAIVLPKDLGLRRADRAPLGPEYERRVAVADATNVMIGGH